MPSESLPTTLRRDYPCAIICLLAAVLLTTPGCKNWSDRKVAESQKRGDQIVLALKAYKQDSGLFPESLDKLKPKYVDAIQPPTAGNRRWIYDRMDGGGNFQLSFETRWGDDGPICSYGSSSSVWYIDTR